MLVVERGAPGQEASRAAGGMLVDSGFETSPTLLTLAKASASMYPEFAHELEIESGMSVDLRDQGAIVFPDSREELDYGTELTPARLREIEPWLDERDHTAFFLDERSVDPRGLTEAAAKTAKNRGVDFSSGDAVTAVNLSDDHVSGVTTIKTAFLSEKVVNCAGAWAGEIGPYAFPTRPVKGQMLCLAMGVREMVRHVIRTPQVYLIPRSDGRLLVGASVEEAGFDKRTDPETMKRFHKDALALVPKLKDARILEDWAGLRPGTPDGLPILGATSTPGYYVATGHFRDGILLAPVTAQVMAEVMEGRSSEYDLAAFSPARFSRQALAS